jgi:hypothetical protein
MFESMDMNIQLQEVWDLANRYNTAIYTVDPRGLAAGEFGIEKNVGARTDSTYLNATMDTLRVLAENSDGRAIVNRNDFIVGMKQVSSIERVLPARLQLDGVNADGKFHEIKVTVKRPGVELRGRKGYWALKPDAAARMASPPHPRTQPARRRAGGDVVPRGRSARTWIGTDRGDAGKTRVRLCGNRFGGARRPCRRTGTGADDGDGDRAEVDALSRPRPGIVDRPEPGRWRGDVRRAARQTPVALVMEGDSPGEVIDSEQARHRRARLYARLRRWNATGVSRSHNSRDAARQSRSAGDAVAAREFSRTDRLLIVAGSTHPARSLRKSRRGCSIAPTSASPTSRSHAGTTAPHLPKWLWQASRLASTASSWPPRATPEKRVNWSHSVLRPDVRRVLLVLVVALVVSPGSALPSGQRATSTPVQLVQIDAIAVDARGRFVADLKAADLRIVEDDVVHPVEELRLVRAAAPAATSAVLRPVTSTSDERAEAKSDETRLAAIFLDEYHVTPGVAVDRVQELLSTLVTRTFSARDLLTVVKPLDS